MYLTGAQILRTLLERQGIATIAGMPGGAILPFYDALHSTDGDGTIRHVLARHEQGAGFIAQGMARVTGRAAVCLATSGPGATNLLTAIADAQLDSIPLVAITGQVPQALIGTDAFQEVDTYGLTLPITKHNFLVHSVEELLETVPLAFTLAESGRPGPVAIDVPKDVLNARLEVGIWPAPGGRRTAPSCDEAQILQLAQQLKHARQPVLYLGGGVIAADAAGLARALAHRLSAPVVSTLMALGAMPPDDPLFMGMLGMHAAKGTNFLLEEADLLVAIGARFDDRATGKVAEFCPRAAIAHIDIDPAEHGKIKQPMLSLVGDAADILRRLLAHVPQQARSAWCARAAELRAAHPLVHPTRDDDPLHPINLCRSLAEVLPDDTIVATDVGQHQMWVAQAYPFRQPRTLLTSGGLGTMGFGLPAAIGAALAAPGRRVLCVSGDGSILMNIQELATLAELDLPVAVVIFNNGGLGLVRQQQQLLYQQHYSASRFHATPDFAAMARAFGIRGVRLDPADNPLEALREALAADGPCVIDVPIEPTANVYPMVPPGAANRQMIAEPALSHA
ncbi:biosynthetic-type acetolactate synthase large subunit [Opitutus terrae]|uniref:Acetolactate synthase n=1 Tax=Opitutus terrae (strain DSM 11246 / JCM 15787 / PB90-1) TaxID=452637 RepID=B1ZN80_OPITP|nr:biosynthetic-type acetolactate synthase large subunit [Opitutus terrae]ACB73449.1 acetolactate synthase, large subunit, biosynthetic type [Opitutus terrae PB90-1]